MSSGRLHDLATVAASVGGGLYFAQTDPSMGILFGLGALSGLMLSPDLDLPKNNARRRWRHVGLGWLWLPYEKVLPHRSFWSHAPIVSTVIRLGYIGLIPWFLMGMPDLSPLMPAFWGLVASDFLHWVLDGTPL